MIRNLLHLAFLVTLPVFAAGTVTVTKTTKAFGKGSPTNYVEVVQVDWVGDASDGSVPATSITLSGYVQKVVTNPGATAPTANYDITLADPEDSALDALASALLNRHTTTTEQVYPRIAGAPGTVSSFPVYLQPGNYSLAIANNTDASATGRILIYLTNSP